MTMQDQEVETEAQAGEETPDTVFRVPVTKGKSFKDISTKRLPEHVYSQALQLGLKQLLNRGQTKITKAEYPDPADLRAAAMEAAEKTLENMYAGKIRIAGASSKDDKVPGVVMTEARRIARNLVKEELKRQGQKVSHYEASVITRAANALIGADPDILEQAREEVEKRGSKKLKIDIKSLVAPSEKKIAAQEAKRAEKVLSATQAGKVATRGRTTPVQPRH